MSENKQRTFQKFKESQSGRLLRAMAYGLFLSSPCWIFVIATAVNHESRAKKKDIPELCEKVDQLDSNYATPQEIREMKNTCTAFSKGKRENLFYRTTAKKLSAGLERINARKRMSVQMIQMRKK